MKYLRHNNVDVIDNSFNCSTEPTLFTVQSEARVEVYAPTPERARPSLI